MTTQIDALKLALEALKENQHLVADNERHAYVMEYNSIIEKCEEALAQPKEPEQEPVAWMIWGKNNVPSLTFKKPSDKYVFDSLYTTPPRREFVGLTDEERQNISLEVPIDAVFITEAKLKEKNT